MPNPRSAEVRELAVYIRKTFKSRGLLKVPDILDAYANLLECDVTESDEAAALDTWFRDSSETDMGMAKSMHKILQSFLDRITGRKQ